MRVISLTTIPPRFSLIGPTLASLLAQRAPADRVILCVPQRYRRFPDYGGSLPEVPEGIEITRPETDYGPASKVLHAARAFAGLPAEILFCDDDRIYPPGWSEVFVQARRQRPEDVIAPISWTTAEMFSHPRTNPPQPQARRANRALDIPHQVKKRLWRLRRAFGADEEGPSHAHIAQAGYRDIFQGYGGVMLRPDFLPPEAFDIPPGLWAVDDIWLSGMLAKAGRGIWAPAAIKGPPLAAADRAAPLHAAEIDQMNRRRADIACFEHLRAEHGVWA